MLTLFQPEVVEFENPLLESNLSEQEGRIIVPGNYALTCLNLNSKLKSYPA